MKQLGSSQDRARPIDLLSITMYNIKHFRSTRNIMPKKELVKKLEAEYVVLEKAATELSYDIEKNMGAYKTNIDLQITTLEKLGIYKGSKPIELKYLKSIKKLLESRGASAVSKTINMKGATDEDDRFSACDDFLKYAEEHAAVSSKVDGMKSEKASMVSLDLRTNFFAEAPKADVDTTASIAENAM